MELYFGLSLGPYKERVDWKAGSQDPDQPFSIRIPEAGAQRSTFINTLDAKAE